MTTKTHYKKLANPDYMGAYSLDDGNNGYFEVDAIVKYVKTQQVTSPQGKKSQELVGFTDKPKPFVINATAQKVLVRLSKSRYVEDWTNIPITFYVETGVKAFGDVVDALRIKAQKPKKKRDFTKQIAAVKSCKTMDELKNLYMSFDPEERGATLKIKDEQKNIIENADN